MATLLNETPDEWRDSIIDITPVEPANEVLELLMVHLEVDRYETSDTWKQRRSV